MVSLFVIATTRFWGALNETTKSTEAAVFKPPKPLAVIPTVWLPSVNVCFACFPAAIAVATSLPSPKSTSKLTAPTAVGVIVTRPVLSWVILKVALTSEGATIPKSVSSKKSSLQPTNVVKTKSKVKHFVYVLIFI